SRAAELVTDRKGCCRLGSPVDAEDSRQAAPDGIRCGGIHSSSAKSCNPKRICRTQAAGLQKQTGIVQHYFRAWRRCGIVIMPGAIKNGYTQVVSITGHHFCRSGKHRSKTIKNHVLAVIAQVVHIEFRVRSISTVVDYADTHR